MCGAGWYALSDTTKESWQATLSDQEQSVCGYDFVLLDRTRCDAYVKSMREFADAELSQRLGAEGLRHLRVVTSSLFLSLIPL